MVALLDNKHGIDQQLSASVKKLLLERIIFQESKMIDEGDQLSQKYQAINAGYKAPSLKQTVSNNTVSSTKKPSEIPGIPTPTIVLFNEAKISLCWKEIRKIGPGLANTGNTCFLNSVLQVLTYTPPLANYILADGHKQKCKVVSFCMLCELCNHIVRMVRHNPHEGAVRPMSIIQKLKCIGKHFRYGRQEDAHEFLRYVVEGIQKSDYAGQPKLDKVSKETTLANAIFGGYYRSQVKCLHCQHESNTYDPMMDINLDIKDCSTIIQALHKSVRPDRLDGENKYHCERCRKKTIAQKRGNIHKAPNVLTFQLKRFDFTQMFGGKISKNVSFPEELNIRPFMSTHQGPPISYKLYAVLVHSGYSCNSGHYYCYVKAPNGTWYEMNDNRVCQVGIHTVLSAQAYLLFYVKKERVKNQPHTTAASTIDLKASKLVQPSDSLFKSLTNGLKTANDNVSILQNKHHKKNHLTLNRSLPIGTPVARKPTPKIIWNKDIKPTKNATPTVPASKPESLTNPNQKPVNNGKDLKSHLNSLQRLSQSYEDSEESPASSVPSSPKTNKTPSAELKDIASNKPNITSAKATCPLVKQLSPSNARNQQTDTKASQEIEKQSHNASVPSLPSEKENISMETVKTNKEEKQADKRRLSLPLNLHNNKRKLISHEFDGNSKIAKPSPLTASPLIPRAVRHHKTSPTKSHHSNPHDKEKTSTPKKVEESNVNHPEVSTSPTKYFGPVLPPSKESINRTRNDSENSEASSIASLQSRSGDWDVSEKEAVTPHRHGNGSLTKQRQHAGWKVRDSEKKLKKESNAEMNHSHHKRKRRYSDSSRESDEEPIPKKKKKKKNKKKKKKKEREPLLENGDEDGSDIVHSDRKNKKKKKKKKKKKNKRSSHCDSSDSERAHETSTAKREKHSKESPDKSHTHDSRVHAGIDRKDEYSDASSSNESKSIKKTSRPSNRKDVPTFKWDDVKKKNVKSWDGSLKNNSTLDYLLNGSSKVFSWSGDVSSTSFSHRHDARQKEKSQDEYDEDYDRGKVKKTKKKSKADNRYDENRSKANDFQRLQDYRNYSKDSTASFRSPTTSSHDNRSSKHRDKHKHLEKSASKFF